MHGLKHYEPKQRRSVRRRNHLAKDLATPKYAPRVVEEKRTHKLDAIRKRDAEEEYHFYKTLGLSSR